jgi:hypothetical protein
MGIFSFGFMKALRASERSIGGDITNLDTKIDNLKVKDIGKEAITKADTATLTAAEVKSGMILCSKNGTATLTLPAAATALKGVVCVFIKTGTAGAITITDGTLSHADAAAKGDSVTVACTGAAWYVIAEKIDTGG